jgi:hypothetical protein
MKDYFALDGGVVINGNVYNQGRFKDGKKKGQEKLVFYPTHTTTGHMFRNIFHDRYWNTLLLYGRWGIGKSLAIVLAAMLSNLITEFNCNNLNTPEAALI